MLCAATLAFVLAVPGAQESAPHAASALILRGGKVWTGVAGAPEAQAILILGERIEFVGSDAEAAARAPAGARTFDLLGRRVVPGIVDAHVHFLSGGDTLLAPDLRGARSEEELARRLGEAAERVPDGTWLTSGTWDHENWPGARLPTAAVLDRFTPRHPVFVARLDGHMAVANSLAMRIAGVGKDTADPPGGAIERDGTGAPAGVFKDAAMALIAKHVPAWSAEQRLERARMALAHAASLGVTSVHDMLDGHDALATYQELRRRGELTARITLYAPITAHALWGGLKVQRGFGDAWLRINGVKAFADGSLGSTTAWFFEPYADAPGTSGLAQTELKAGGMLDRQLAATLRDGLQPAIHAIGDRAIRAVLDLAAARAKPAQRLRLEHAQHIHPDDLPRFAGLGVIASMQPYHAIDDGRWAEKRIGAERCRTTYAFRSLLDRGAVLAFGSDWPVAPLSPWEGLYAAVTRRTLDGRNPEGWVPEQRIRLEEALRAYTAGSAYAGFAETEVGTLEPGKYADLVVLEPDLFALPAERLREIAVRITLVGGRVTHLR